MACNYLMYGILLLHGEDIGKLCNSKQTLMYLTQSLVQSRLESKISRFIPRDRQLCLLKTQNKHSSDAFDRNRVPPPVYSQRLVNIEPRVTLTFC
jgi:hypothetical protein